MGFGAKISKLLYHINRAIRRFSPRDRHIIIYGGACDLFIDNAKHLFILNNKQLPNYRHVWLSRNPDTISNVKHLGFEAYNSDSKIGKELQRKAGFIIYDYLIDEFATHLQTEGAIRLELWHGVPYCKRICPANVDNQKPYIVKSKFMYYFFVDHEYGDYCLTQGAKANKIYSSSFRIPEDHLLLSDYPRNRFFYMNEKDIEGYIEQYEDDNYNNLYQRLKKDQTTKIIYMPTFRDGNPNYIYEAIPDFTELNDFCKKNNLTFYLKVHRMTPLPQNMDFSNIKVLDNKMDIYPLLPSFDRLVTDYSSIMYEFALMNKPVILYIYDLEDYEKRSRSVNSDFKEMIKIVSSAKNVLQLKELLAAETSQINKFPTSGYFDCPGDYSAIFELIENNTK